LIDVFGKNGEHFWYLARGIDERGVETETETKSIGNEITFDKDTTDKEKIEGTLMALCEKVTGRMRQEGFKGRTVTLKIRLEGFKTYTRGVTMSTPINFEDVLYKQVKILYNRFDTKGRKVRLVGVSVSNLSSTDSREWLFRESVDKKRESIHEAVDKIKARFGDGFIHRAASGKIIKIGGRKHG